MPSLSCYLIVRDAEDTLDRCLASVRPHVDELVIVDTGSTDGTCEIAARYADCLVGFEWCDNFAAARQFALERCAGDWCMWLDADDELIGGEHLRGLVSGGPADRGMYLLRYVTDRAPSGEIRMEFWRERVVRSGAARWAGRAHEVLVPTGELGYERFAGAWVLHHGHGSPEGSLARNIRLLELDLADDPDNTRTQFYLGRDLVTSGDTERGRAVLDRYLESATWPDEAFIAAQLVGYCHRKAGRHLDAYRADLRLLAINPLWPQAYFALAEDSYYLGRWDWVIHFAEIGQLLPRPDTNLFQSAEALDFAWMIHAAVALYRTGRLPEAAELTARALRLRPDDPLHRQNAEFFAGELRRLEAEHRAELGQLVVPEPAPVG